MKLPFKVSVSSFEETLDKSSFKTAEDYAVANATGKAREVASRDVTADLVIGRYVLASFWRISLFECP